MPSHVLEVMYELNLSLFSRPSNWHVLMTTCMPFRIYRIHDQNLSILLYNPIYFNITDIPGEKNKQKKTGFEII